MEPDATDIDEKLATGYAPFRLSERNAQVLDEVLHVEAGVEVALANARAQVVDAPTPSGAGTNRFNHLKRVQPGPGERGKGTARLYCGVEWSGVAWASTCLKHSLPSTARPQRFSSNDEDHARWMAFCHAARFETHLEAYSKPSATPIMFVAIKIWFTICMLMKVSALSS